MNTLMLCATIAFYICTAKPHAFEFNESGSGSASYGKHSAVILKPTACDFENNTFTLIEGRPCAALAINQTSFDKQSFPAPFKLEPVRLTHVANLIPERPQKEPEKLAALRNELQKTKLVRCFPNIVDNLFYIKASHYILQPSSIRPNFMKIGKATADSLQRGLLEEPDLGPAAQIFHMKPGGDEDSKIDFAYFPNVSQPIKTFGGSVGFWISYDDTMIRGFLDIPQDDMGRLSEMLLKVKLASGRWTRELPSTLHDLNRMPNAFRIRACGMSEVALSYVARGGQFSERVTLVVEDATFRIVAERLEYGL